MEGIGRRGFLRAFVGATVGAMMGKSLLAPFTPQETGIVEGVLGAGTWISGGHSGPITYKQMLQTYLRLRDDSRPEPQFYVISKSQYEKWSKIYDELSKTPIRTEEEFWRLDSELSTIQRDIIGGAEPARIARLRPK